MDSRALASEFMGTFALVGAVCGAGLFAAPAGAGLAGVAFAVGFAYVAMAYAVGHISGGHFNPAVTLGLVAAGRFDASGAIGYIIAQLLGGIAAAALFWVVLAGAIGGKWNDFAAISNIYGGKGQFTMLAALAIEAVLVGLFVFIIVGATSRGSHEALAPVAIGLSLTLFHLMAIPVSNAALNPARATATAVFAGGPALLQLWAFWAALILGAVAGGVIARWVHEE